ncbi:MAG TPA: hypothetical protein VM096_15010 [Vicinamibacterales bacterium]|nr:hypothetical protein [Vicinamibacterales bacterium]
MPNRRPIVAAVLAGLLSASPAAQAPSLNEVLKRSALYVGEFRRQLSRIVAEETYRQEIIDTGRSGNGVVSGRAVRTLRSDFLVVKPSDSERLVELRDVFEVDGKPVRNRQARLEQLLDNPNGRSRIEDIISASARYNIGKIQRTINTPLMALLFLDAAHQHRFDFKHAANAQAVFTDARDRAFNDTAVFRVATEIWTVEFTERRRPTIIRAPNGDDRPAKGRFWINPANGSVLISELIVDGGGVIATVTASYQSEPLMGFLVPVEMRESYLRDPERITGRAEYGKFRRINSSAP